MSTENACPACEGTGVDNEHKWPDGSPSACETCDGYGVVEPKPATQPIILQAAFTIETLAHLKGFERELLPQAEHLRKMYQILKSIEDYHDSPYFKSGGDAISYQDIKELLK
jgi:hypothetical protein